MEETIQKTEVSADLNEVDLSDFDFSASADGEEVAKPTEEAAPETETAEKQQRPGAAKEPKAWVDEDARTFIEKHPNIDVGAIPKEVWDKVNQGEPLVSAYDNVMAENTKKELAVEIERLKAELEAIKKDADNKQRSTGSATSAGKDTGSDPWLADLESRLD